MKRRYVFGGWTLDGERGVLSNGLGEVALRPKSLQVLQRLIDDAGRMVSRDDLLDAVWPGISVTEESLTQCISDVRAALRDSEQLIIKTVPKRGYVLVPDVSEAPADGRIHPLPEGPTIAVLPFANLSGDATQDYLGDGLTEDIINNLSYFSQLSVIARSSSFSYKGRAVDIREVAKQLGVRHVVEGSVRRFANQLRITARLIDARTGVQRWSERFDRTVNDIFAVQDEIVRAIVRIVVAHLGAAEEERIAGQPRSSWSTYDLMMQGDHAWRELEKTWIPSHLAEARRLFEAAYAADPHDARICARLSLTLLRAHADPTTSACGDPELLRRGYEMAARAVSLDPNLPFARARLGWAYFWMGQLDNAIREFERSMALNPNFSDLHFPAVLNFAGEPIRALDLLQAQARLDPFHPSHVHAIQGHSLFMLRRYEEAVAPLKECIRRGPHGALGHVWLAATFVRLDDRGEARGLISELRSRLPHLDLTRWRIFELYRDRADRTHMLDALHEAGLE
jgi:adenylate cyclase